MPGAEPIRHDGGPVAVMLVHGFTSTPASLSEWAGALAENGFTVSVPRLPGHGTTWQEMNRTRWQDWYAAVEHELLDLAESHRQVFVGGLSMGGALALRLAVHHPALVAGLMLVNPCVTLADRREFRSRRADARPAGAPAPGRGAAADRERHPQAGHVELAYDRTPLNALHSAASCSPTSSAPCRR